MKCSTSTCRCRQEGDPGHGPYYLLVRNLEGKRTSRSLPTAAAATVQAQLACARPAPTSGPRQKKVCAQEFAAAIEAELARFVAPGAADPVDFEALESRFRQLALELAARAVEQRFNADRSDYAGPALPCPCRQPARYAGRRAKTVETVLGGLTLERAYYHCASCGHGFFLRDRALGMARTDLSPGVTRMSGASAALVSFAQASGLLDDRAGVRVGTKHVQRTAEALGRAIAARERQGPDPVPRRGRHRRTGAPERDRRTARPARARSSWSPSGPPKRSTRKADRPATTARSPTRPRSRAPLASTPTPTRRPSPSACAARPSGAASRLPGAA